MIFFDDIPVDALATLKSRLSGGERPSAALHQLYDSIGIKHPDQVSLSAIIDLLEWCMPDLDTDGIRGYIIDSCAPFFASEQESKAFDELIANNTKK